ncbi:MAG: alpha/beta fold hydrolase [Anaerolineae bacterium]|nr:alpha/beta fold hydrolase [Anaerolineae bacterium]
MPNVHTNGIDLYYEVTGSGEPLVLIAGLGYGLWMWHKMVPGLARHFQVIAFDNRGAGQSSKPDGSYSAPMMAADTAGLIDALGLRGAAVMGHSMGGFIAQQLVLDRPDLVGKLILSATNFGGPHHVPVTPEAMAVILDRSGDPIDVVKRGIAVACAPGFIDAHPELVEELVAYRLTGPVPPAQYQAQTAVGIGLMSEAACFEHRLKDVTAPTLILFGEHDKVVPPANAELLAQQIPGSRIVILPGAGHMFPIEAPEAAVEAITAFLEK